MMSETYFDEQAGPVCPQASVDPANIVIPQPQFSQQNLYHLAALFSQLYSSQESSPHQNLVPGALDQDNLSLHFASQLQALCSLSQDLSPLFGVSCNGLNTGNAHFTNLDSLHTLTNTGTSNQSQRSLDAYYQVLSIMPFSDDEPLDKHNFLQNLESRINISIQAETADSVLDITQVQSVPVNVALTVAPIEASFRPSIDIVCVIEKSQETAPEFLNAVRSSINKLISILDHNDRLSLILYDDFGYRITGLNRMTEDNKETVRESLYNVYLSGGVNLADGVGQAMEVLKQRKCSNQMTSIFVMGASNDLKSLTKLEFLNQKYANEGVHIHSFGYLEGTDNVLQCIADKNNGAYHYIRDENELTNSLSNTLSSLFQIHKQDSELYLFANSKISPYTNSFGSDDGDNFMWAIPEKCCKIKIPYTEDGFSQEFKLEVTISNPEISFGVEQQQEITLNLLDAVYRTEALDNIIMKKESLKISVANPGIYNRAAFEQELEEYERELFNRNQRSGRELDSLDKVNRLVAIEKLIMQANWLLQYQQTDEAKKIAVKLRCQAQGLGMEFEVVIKNVLEKIYQQSSALSFDDFVETDF